MKRYRWWLLLSVPAVVLGGLALNLPRGDTPLLTDPRAWLLRGSFDGGAPLPGLVYSGGLPTFSPSKEDALYWVATAKKGDGSGGLISAPVPAPRWITFTVTGDLTRPENNVYLLLSGENQRIRVTAQTQPYCWRRVTIGLPGDWIGKPMRVAIDSGPRDADNIIGISNPRALASGTVLLSHLRALLILPVCAVSLVLFLLPGLPLAAGLAARGVVAPSRIVVVAGIFGCLAGYLAFWAYFCRAVVGYCIGGAVLLGGAAWLALGLRRGRATRSLLLSAEVTIPVVLLALVAFLYTSLWLSVNLWIPFHFTPRLRFLDFVMMQDNIIPYFLSDRLYAGADPRQVLNEWQTSDRPPLQAGILLLQLPLARLFQQPIPWSLVYGCVLQCLWVPAVWEFWLAAGLSRKRSGLALLFLVLTGFMLVNSVFTWPKLLSAALVVNAISFAWFRGRPAETAHPMANAGLWGLAAALGFLAHGGVAFTLLPFGLFLLLPRYFPGIRGLAIAAGVAIATVLPWNLYQALYEPPGTRLIREHLAGRSETWQNSRSVLTNLADAYRSLSPKEIVENKWSNLEVLFRASRHPGEDHFPWPPLGEPKPWPVDAVSLRRCEFLCLLWAPGLLNLGWLAAAVLVWRRPPVLNATLGIAAPVLAVASVVVWVLLMFGPGTTVVHQGSYATVVLLLLSSTAWLTVLPGWLPYVVLVAQGVLFTRAWLFTSPANDYGLQNPFMIAAAAASFAALCRVAMTTSGSGLPAGKK
jgi:hypothetical protein